MGQHAELVTHVFTQANLDRVSHSFGVAPLQLLSVQIRCIEESLPELVVRLTSEGLLRTIMR